jgi:uncharacterized membrane protein (UPF0127 family)
MRVLTISKADGAILCRAGVADNVVTRGVGLLGRASLAPDAGLLIVPCTSVHTWFMRFTIDVVYLTRDDVVVKATTMPPFRFSLGGRGAKKVLELSKGAIERSGIRAGDRLAFQEVAKDGEAGE